MNPFDRINQLTDQNAILRTQLEDARKQLEADSATIAKLAKDKRELVSAMQDAEFLLRQIGMNWREAGAMSDSCKRSSQDMAILLSRHA